MTDPDRSDIDHGGLYSSIWYAREQVDPSLWQTCRFAEVNRLVTIGWILVFAAMAVSHVIAGAIDTQRAEPIFNWVIPIAPVVGMVKYMGKVRTGADPAQA